MKMKLLLATGVALSMSALAQANPQNTTPAVNYRHHSGATKVNFAGTDLMPTANGEAEVNSKRGTIEVKAEFGNLQSAITFGKHRMTYILWAISPEARSVNLG